MDTIADPINLPGSPAEACQETGFEPVSPRPSSENRWTAWDRFVETTSETGFMQTSWWVEFRNYCGFENFGITLTDGRTILGGAVVLKYSYSDDGCFYYIQDGPVLPKDPVAAEDVFQAVIEAIEERRKTEPQVVSHLRIEPRWMQLPSFVSGFRGLRPLADCYVEPRDTRLVDLRPGEDAILAQMKPKGRYNIGVARRHGVSIVEDMSEQGLSDFYAIYEETAQRQRMEPKPPDYFERLVSLLLPAQRGSLFFAQHQGRRIATALVVYFGARATYFFGGSRDIDRQVMAPYLLHFEAMRKARVLGHDWYDLWGVAPPDDPKHPWCNLSVFKAKFGGLEVRLVPTLDFVYDEAAYERYVAGHHHCGDNGSRDPLAPECT